MDSMQYMDSDYMTVGEIAAKAGVTIRTVQYYDQKGLLKPSAKGSRNLRLYTPQDLDRLYRILCYKFLGLTLDEIQKQVKGDESAHSSQQITEELQKRITKEGQMINEGMKRYALLKDMQKYIEQHDVVNWGSYVELIDYLQEKWNLIWEINRAYEEDRQMNWDTVAGTELKEYYRLIAETIRLMREGVSSESDEAMEIIAQYRRMKEGEAEKAVEPASFEKQPLLYVDPVVMATDAIDYTEVWKEIKGFLSEAGKHYRETNREE